MNKIAIIIAIFICVYGHIGGIRSRFFTTVGELKISVAIQRELLLGQAMINNYSKVDSEEAVEIVKKANKNNKRILLDILRLNNIKKADKDDYELRYDDNVWELKKI